ncbi:hypothetical protein ASE69_20090 [Sphingomonas sp. Leaf208]|uniref:hypothetical protein n=1 Tax=Sphingomonas sp. Leaf208 TaxID=1735679 RepID=UPI0006FBC414|nr:hypothetical protein [Sphingomonas sp. Leaf208]KQM52119.1 hypothetical protein ASE69_20090 [Sphingomonas sp. Leaf208]
MVVSLIKLLIPVLDTAFPGAVTPPMALNLALFFSSAILVAYAAGVAWLASRDHRRISAEDDTGHYSVTFFANRIGAMHDVIAPLTTC